MVILVPLKPVVVLWLLLSAMLWAGYVAFSLIEGKNPFAPHLLHHGHSHQSSDSDGRARHMRKPV